MNTKFKQFILLGLPGVGVKEQAIALADRWHVAHLSMDTLVQAAIASQSQVGIAVQPYVEAGESVPDELLVKVLRKRLQQPDAMLDGWVLDGFPLTMAQAEAFEQVVSAFGLPDPTIVYLKAMKGLLINRLWMATGQQETMPVIRRRVTQQEEALAPVVAYYKERSRLKTVNGSLSFEEISAALFQMGYEDEGAALLIKDEAELDTLLAKESLLVVDCLASWCGSCKLVTPIIDELAKIYGDRAHIRKIDFDANQQIPARFGLEGMPAVMFFKDGELVETLTGVKSYQVYSDTITRFLEEPVLR
ncbi:MAG: nucleoside monophosphate kinase [Leptolyngbyaceae cyanobacterium]